MKLLAVYDTRTKRIQGIEPYKATGVPIPAFRSGLALPRAGTTPGEAFINSNTGIASVWDGNQWNPIAQPVVAIHPTEGVLLQDNPADDTVALAQDTGNVFVMTNGEWRSIGVRVFATPNQRDAWAAPEGSIAFSRTDGALAVRTAMGFLFPQGQATGTVVSSDAELTTGVQAIIASGVAGSWLQMDAAYTYDATTGVVPQITENIDGANNDWVIYDGANFRVVDGLGEAMPGQPVPTGLPTWAAVNSQRVFIGQASPANPRVGDQWFDQGTRTLFTFDGVGWNAPASGVPMGTIITHASLTPPAGYLLCDGSTIPNTPGFDPLRNLLGANNLPDLRDQFIRGATTQQQIDGWSKHLDTTRRPRQNSFTGATNTTGNHQHSVNTRHSQAAADWDYMGGYQSGSNYKLNVDPTGWNNGNVKAAGNHSHTVTINGGGDAETAPVHIRLAYHIKALP